MNGRILHLVKTFDGALWAAQMARELIGLGWEVHVMAPKLEGRLLQIWKDSGAILHEGECEFPVKTPWLLNQKAQALKAKIESIKPDLIHSHFVSTTLLLRYSLKDNSIPRVFQVPGPLHLENYFFGLWEMLWSNSQDWWVASSKYTKNIYLRKYSVPQNKIFLSYYGIDLPQESTELLNLKELYHIPADAILIGNVSYIYPPKFYLGQKVGLKGHELMIEALGRVMKKNDKVYAVFIGSQWGKGEKYFNHLKNKALKLSPNFIFTGYMPGQKIHQALKSIDLVLHVPASENCGGVVEPLLNQVPVIASATGGLPEIIVTGKTGVLLKERNADHIEQAVLNFLNRRELAKSDAQLGKSVIKEFFDVKRTSREIAEIYKYILGHSISKPEDFNSKILVGNNG